jgi:hypothetical protein
MSGFLDNTVRLMSGWLDQTVRLMSGCLGHTFKIMSGCLDNTIRLMSVCLDHTFKIMSGWLDHTVRLMSGCLGHIPSFPYVSRSTIRNISLIHEDSVWRRVPETGQSAAAKLTNKGQSRGVEINRQRVVISDDRLRRFGWWNCSWGCNNNTWRWGRKHPPSAITVRNWEEVIYHTVFWN